MKEFLKDKIKDVDKLENITALIMSKESALILSEPFITAHEIYLQAINELNGNTTGSATAVLLKIFIGKFFHLLNIVTPLTKIVIRILMGLSKFCKSFLTKEFYKLSPPPI